jgi:hypothetical protein
MVDVQCEHEDWHRDIAFYGILPSVNDARDVKTHGSMR